MLVVSRIRFFTPTANDSSPESPVAGSWPVMHCQWVVIGIDYLASVVKIIPDRSVGSAVENPAAAFRTGGFKDFEVSTAI